MATINIGQLVATTLRHRQTEVVDNMSDNVPFYNRVRKRNNMKVGGGRDLVIPLDYADNASFMFYSGYETLDISVNDIIDAATYDWKQASVAVSFSGLELRRNSGREGIIKIVSAKVKNATRTFINNMGAQVHADGAGTGGKEIGGLGLLVPTTPTNQVGGIDANTYSFWQSQIQDNSTVLGTSTVSTNIQSALHQQYSNLMRNNDKPDLVLMSGVYWRLFWDSLTAIQRISESSSANAGFGELKFVGADVINEGGVNGNMDDSATLANATWFMLNMEYIGMWTHPDANMEVVGGERMSVNQDAHVQLMLWMGNMWTSNRRLQGKAKE